MREPSRVNSGEEELEKDRQRAEYTQERERKRGRNESTVYSRDRGEENEEAKRNALIYTFKH